MSKIFILEKQNDLAVVRFDVPGEAVNTWTDQAVIDFEEVLTGLERDMTRWHGPYTADRSNAENRRIFEEGSDKIRRNPVLQKLAGMSETLELEEADQADANLLNYILQEWVRFQGRLRGCPK